MFATRTLATLSGLQEPSEEMFDCRLIEEARSRHLNVLSMPERLRIFGSSEQEVRCVSVSVFRFGNRRRQFRRPRLVAFRGHFTEIVSLRTLAKEP